MTSSKRYLHNNGNNNCSSNSNSSNSNSNNGSSSNNNNNSNNNGNNQPRYQQLLPPSPRHCNLMQLLLATIRTSTCLLIFGREPSDACRSLPRSLIPICCDRIRSR